jgi:hypothetical protein
MNCLSSRLFVLSVSVSHVSCLLSFVICVCMLLERKWRFSQNPYGSAEGFLQCTGVQTRNRALGACRFIVTCIGKTCLHDVTLLLSLRDKTVPLSTRRLVS